MRLTLQVVTWVALNLFAIAVVAALFATIYFVVAYPVLLAGVAVAVFVWIAWISGGQPLHKRLAGAFGIVLLIGIAGAWLLLGNGDDTTLTPADNPHTSGVSDSSNFSNFSDFSPYSDYIPDGR
ncbi:MAG TPA: hypothetical protein VFC53_01470 [Dehalococcoidia bacterium]|nr:hypothetical protein [Dehalococcoidia bacterium]